MINFLHTFEPNSILFSLGPINLYWYGLLIVLGIILALLTAIKLSSYYSIKNDAIIDLAFWLIIFGIIGARIYHILIELPYYISHPLEIIQIWHGGMAIHGAIIAGVITIYYFTKKHALDFWKICAILVPGLALAQTVGRWGNYFNQELFGKPTSLPWGIPINLFNRPLEYLNNNFFHPTFLYESLGNFLIFLLLILLHISVIKNNQKLNLFCEKIKISCFEIIVLCYLTLYSMLRFFMEYLRTDQTYVLLGLRFPQIVSILIIILCLLYPLIKIKKYANNK